MDRQTGRIWTVRKESKIRSPKSLCLSELSSKAGVEEGQDWKSDAAMLALALALTVGRLACAARQCRGCPGGAEARQSYLPNCNAKCPRQTLAHWRNWHTSPALQRAVPYRVCLIRMPDSDMSTALLFAAGTHSLFSFFRMDATLKKDMGVPRNLHYSAKVEAPRMTVALYSAHYTWVPTQDVIPLPTVPVSDVKVRRPRSCAGHAPTLSLRATVGEDQEKAHYLSQSRLQKTKMGRYLPIQPRYLGQIGTLQLHTHVRLIPTPMRLQMFHVGVLIESVKTRTLHWG